MNQISTDPSAAKQSPAQKLESVLSSRVRSHGPQRMLLIESVPGSIPGIDSSCAGLMVRTGLNGEAGELDIRCDANELPFTNESFSLVMVHNLVHSGNEDVIEEARRVLGSRGLLVILGRGQLGKGQTMSLMPHAVCRKLKDLGFVIEQCTGFGLWGRAVYLDKRWQKMILPASDQILISGKLKINRPVVTQLRFGQPQAAGARSTPIDALSREAV